MGIMHIEPIVFLNSNKMLRVTIVAHWAQSGSRITASVMLRPRDWPRPHSDGSQPLAYSLLVY